MRCFKMAGVRRHLPYDSCSIWPECITFFVSARGPCPQYKLRPQRGWGTKLKKADKKIGRIAYSAKAKFRVLPYETTIT